MRTVFDIEPGAMARVHAENTTLKVQDSSLREITGKWAGASDDENKGDTLEREGMGLDRRWGAPLPRDSLSFDSLPLAEKCCSFC